MIPQQGTTHSILLYLSFFGMDPQIRSALGTLKAGTEEALQMLDLLHKTIHNNDIPEMVNWCDHPKDIMSTRSR